MQKAIEDSTQPPLQDVIQDETGVFENSTVESPHVVSILHANMTQLDSFAGTGGVPGARAKGKGEGASSHVSRKKKDRPMSRKSITASFGRGDIESAPGKSEATSNANALKFANSPWHKKGQRKSMVAARCASATRRGSTLDADAANEQAQMGDAGRVDQLIDPGHAVHTNPLTQLGGKESEQKPFAHGSGSSIVAAKQKQKAEKKQTAETTETKKTTGTKKPTETKGKKEKQQKQQKQQKKKGGAVVL
jgi:hypothetical protein